MNAPASASLTNSEHGGFSIDEWFVVLLSRTIRDLEVVFHGFGSPCAQVAMHVAKHTHAGTCCWSKAPPMR